MKRRILSLFVLTSFFLFAQSPVFGQTTKTKLHNAIKNIGLGFKQDIIDLSKNWKGKYLFVAVRTLTVNYNTMGPDSNINVADLSNALSLTIAMRVGRKKYQSWKPVLFGIGEMPSWEVDFRTLGETVFPETVVALEEAVGEALPKQSIFLMPVLVTIRQSESYWIVWTVRKDSSGNVNSYASVMFGGMKLLMDYIEQEIQQVK